MITVGNLRGLEVDFKIYGLRDDETFVTPENEN